MKCRIARKSHTQHWYYARQSAAMASSRWSGWLCSWIRTPQTRRVSQLPYQRHRAVRSTHSARCNCIFATVSERSLCLYKGYVPPLVRIAVEGAIVKGGNGQVLDKVYSLIARVSVAAIAYRSRIKPAFITECNHVL